MTAIIILVLASTLIIYLFLWYAFVKKQYGSGYSAGGKFVKFIFLLPFWSLFFFKLSTAYLPEINKIIKPVRNLQEISFENDLQNPMEIVLLQRIDSTNNWVPAYKLNKRVFSPEIHLHSGEADLFEFRGDNSDAFYAVLSNTKDPVYNSINAKPIPVLIPPRIQKVYFSEIIRSRAKSPNVLLEDEYVFLGILLIGIQGFWYHALRVRKFIKKAVAIFFALNISFFAGFAAYYIGKTVYFFLDLF